MSRPRSAAVVGGFAVLLAAARVGAVALVHGPGLLPRAMRVARSAPQIRYVRYAPNRVYHLHGVAGYEIDLQFAPGERFRGLGVGDAKAIRVAATSNHLFIKPRAVRVATDLTVLTNRRAYVFSYRTGSAQGSHATTLYALRFVYPRTRQRASSAHRQRSAVARELSRAEHAPARNTDYWYCGPSALRPTAAWDDGVETHLVFPSREPLPAVFVRNADGSESVVNFDMRANQMVIHRIAQRFILKRGRLTGCIVNRGFAGSGRRLPSGTISPRVWRVTRRMRRHAIGRGGER
ncbi:MAG: TrbG/VirB9 family P-type conjugative transfer protein [Steroidobacteraceae bacterium]